MPVRVSVIRKISFKVADEYGDLTSYFAEPLVKYWPEERVSSYPDNGLAVHEK